MCKFVRSHANEWLKRQAAQVASQLPEDRIEALAVLAMAHQIIVGLGRTWSERPPTGAAVPPCQVVPDGPHPKIKLVSSDPD